MGHVTRAFFLQTQVSIKMLKEVHTCTHPGITLSPEARAETKADLADEEAELADEEEAS